MPPFPPTTKYLLIACVAIFCIGTFLPPGLFAWLALWPAGSGNFLPWQVVTYALLHGDTAHLIFNMLGLWLFGAELEMLWGRKRFLQYIVACVLSAAAAQLLESVKRHDPHIFTKSGVMVGLGEERLEVHQVMDDMRSADIDFLTMGQYLQPTPRHAKVMEFVTPQAFNAYAAIARAKGFLLVAASPLTRSSYHAGDDFEKMRAAREAKLAAVRS